MIISEYKENILIEFHGPIPFIRVRYLKDYNMENINGST